MTAVLRRDDPIRQEVAAAHRLGQVLGAAHERDRVQAGMDRVQTAGAAFDPDTMVTDDKWSAKSRVASELEAGFLWNGKVLRPARVSLK